MPFQPGNKLAVGHGPPKLPEEFKKKCRAAVDADVLQAWINEVKERGEHWVKCSELLAAYGYGKPSQAVEVTGANGGPIEATISPERRLELIRRLSDAGRESSSTPVAH